MALASTAGVSERPAPVPVAATASRRTGDTPQASGVAARAARGTDHARAHPPPRRSNSAPGEPAAEKPRRHSRLRRALGAAWLLASPAVLRSVGAAQCQAGQAPSLSPKDALQGPSGGPAAGSPPRGSPWDRVYSKEEIASLRRKTPLNPIREAGDPYRRTNPVDLDAWASHYCGVRFPEPGGTEYIMRTFASEEEARAAGFSITHKGSCGTCSTLQDLAAYLETRDLTIPVRRCAIRVPVEQWLADTFGRDNALGARDCLKNLGLSDSCANSWYYNALNSSRECRGACWRSWLRREPFNRPDGSLNACLQCDEDRSGPVFKTSAGRTRRNSGIRSGIERRETELYPVDHDYGI